MLVFHLYQCLHEPPPTMCKSLILGTLGRLKVIFVNSSLHQHEITLFMLCSSFISTFSLTFFFHKINFASDQERLPSYFIKKQEVVETGFFTKVIRYQRHESFRRYAYYIFKDTLSGLR